MDGNPENYIALGMGSKLHQDFLVNPFFVVIEDKK